MICPYCGKRELQPITLPSGTAWKCPGCGFEKPIPEDEDDEGTDG